MWSFFYSIYLYTLLSSSPLRPYLARLKPAQTTFARDTFFKAPYNARLLRAHEMPTLKFIYVVVTQERLWNAQK